jgi:hypothetical protein
MPKQFNADVKNKKKKLEKAIQMCQLHIASS